LMGSFLVLNGEIIGQGLRTKPQQVRTFLKSLSLQVDSLIGRLAPSVSSARRSNQRIDLIVAVHDQTHCLHVVNFLDMDTKEGGILYEKAISTAKHWHALLDGLILKADHFEHLQGEIRDAAPVSSSDSVEAELDQLTELVDKQLITEKEFEVQKERILAGKT
ncbi:MAG: SHOCT domain-containing protein, partial [Nitrospirales bacterium]|nr:SHOCT domain-containing protein [Nitrospirales bacterium]